MTKLEAIADQASQVLNKKIIENQEKIQQAITEATELAQVSDSELKFKLTFQISINLDEGNVQHQLGWNVRFTDTTSSPIPDPDQIELELKDKTKKK